MMLRELIVTLGIWGVMWALESEGKNGEELSWRAGGGGNNTYEPFMVPASSRITLDCRIKGRRHLFFYVSWLKDGIPLRPSSSLSLKKGRLLIEDSKESDAGNYTCAVRQGSQVIYRHFLVKVISRVVAHPPIIKDSLPGNHTLLRGQNLTLRCQVEYDHIVGSLSVAWVRHRFINGSLHLTLLQNCSYDDSYCTVTLGNRRKENIHAGAISLYNLKVEDSGPYSCIVNNRYGFDVSTGIIKVLKELPERLEMRQARFESKIIVSLSVPFVIILLIVCLCWMLKVRKAKKKQKENALSVLAWTKKVTVEKSFTDSNLIAPKVTLEKIRSIPKRDKVTGKPVACEYDFDVDKRWEIPREYLILGDELGEGNFGKVLEASMLNIECEQRFSVAIKMLKEGHTDSDVIDLVKEVEIMKSVGYHVNVLSLLGVCTQPNGSQPLWAVVEHARHGSLKTYLLKLEKASSVLSPKEMYSFAHQIASGMLYLSRKKCVHRDLAARNILLADNYVIKVADFGMARNICDKEYYRMGGQGKLPVKWMAPEAYFQNLSSTQSDVWSYGVLLWEIASYAQQPYRDIFDVKLMFEKLKAGYRLEKPPECPNIFYNLMLRCWNYRPEKRPDWTVLRSYTELLKIETYQSPYLTMSSRKVEDPDPLDAAYVSYDIPPHSLSSSKDPIMRSRPLSCASGYCNIVQYSQPFISSFKNGFNNYIYGDSFLMESSDEELSRKLFMSSSSSVEGDIRNS